MKSLFFTLSFFLFFTNTNIYSQTQLKHRVDNSNVIVEGQIIDQYSIFNESKTRIYTVNTVLISKIFKGNLKGQRLNIITIGGSLEGHSYTAFHSESLYLNQEGIFFINPLNENKKGELNRYFENDLNLYGRFNSIIYSNDSSQPAKDRYQIYTSIESIFSIINGITNTEPVILSPNCWEKVEEENRLEFSGSKNATIEYKFQKVTYDYPFLNIDISALSNLTGIFYAGGRFLVNYDGETLGQYLVSEEKFNVTHSELLSKISYNLDYSDLDTESIGLNLSLENKSDLMPLSPSERNIMSFKINLESLNDVSKLELDKLQMASKSFYYDRESNEIKTFKEVIVPTEIPIQNGCIIFSPEQINAGVGELLTITPEDPINSNFGNIKGVVYMGNAEDHLVLNQVNDHHIIQWSPNEITVLIPHKTDQAAIIGSGDIEVHFNDQNGFPTIFRSKKPLHVCYNITNDNCIGIIEDELIDVYNDNGEGGYTFHLGSKLDEIPNARSVIEDAICKWASETGVNFTLSETVIPNPTPNPDPLKPGIPLTAGNDNLNIIFLGDMNSGFTETTDDQGNLEPLPTAEALLYKTGFDPEANDPDWNECLDKRWIIDCDIIINDEKEFYIGIDDNEVPEGKIDFSSTIIHELGHAHSHHHATLPWTGIQKEQTKTMYYSLLPTMKKRYIDKGCAVFGSEFMLEHSQQLVVVPRMVEGDCEPNAVQDFNRRISPFFSLSPNPFLGHFELTFLSDIRDENIYIELLESTGKPVYSVKISAPNEVNIIRPNQDLADGLYFIKIRIGDKIYSRKIIKSN